MTSTETVVAAYIGLLVGALAVLHLLNPRPPRPSRVPPARPRVEHAEGWTTSSNGGQSFDAEIGVTTSCRNGW